MRRLKGEHYSWSPGRVVWRRHRCLTSLWYAFAQDVLILLPFILKSDLKEQ